MIALLSIPVLLSGVVFSNNAHQTEQPNCVRACALSLRSSVLAILGAQGTPYTSLLAPFHHIISKSDDVRHALRKSAYTCNGVLRFEDCVRKCERSLERDTWLSAIGHWILFCSIIGKPNKGVVEYMHCERDHLRRTKKNCGTLNISPESSFSYFCRKFEKYRRCYNKVTQTCSTAAQKIKRQLDEEVLHTYDKLMKLHSNRIRIPNKCSAWVTSRYSSDFDHPSEDGHPQSTMVPTVDETEITNMVHGGHHTTLVPILRAIDTEPPSFTTTTPARLTTCITVEAESVPNTSSNSSDSFSVYNYFPMSLLKPNLSNSFLNVALTIFVCILNVLVSQRIA